MQYFLRLLFGKEMPTIQTPPLKFSPATLFLSAMNALHEQ